MYLRGHTGIQPVPAKTVDSIVFFFRSPSLLSGVNVDQSKYRRAEGTKACSQSREWKDGCTVWYNSTPAAARHGIMMSWTNKENAGVQTCKVTKYRMIRRIVNDIEEGYPT